MSQPLARNAFQKGLTAIEEGRFIEALAFIEASMELTRRAGAVPPLRCLSYYGLCLAMTRSRLDEALEICHGAVECEGGDPDLYLNLGRVYLARGNRQRAFEAFVRGLQIDRRHGAILREVHDLGFRRRPVLPFLGRRHPLNRMLGMMRSGIAARPEAPSGGRESA